MCLWWHCSRSDAKCRALYTFTRQKQLHYRQSAAQTLVPASFHTNIPLKSAEVMRPLSAIGAGGKS